MCGIAGILKYNNTFVDSNELQRMTDAIIHRGPDGEGHWVNNKKNIGFGHRRLSIIDLSDNGKQPMHYADGRYAITFNGEIYNYIELKEQLIKKGYQFYSDSDTEVLLALYQDKKENCLTYLDGMFAFAIWDEKEQELFCARDRFGEKPFHYYQDPTQFVFGSEIKEFWALGIERKVSAYRAELFLKHGLVDDYKDVTSTYYEGIKKLDAAHYMRVTSSGKIQITKYWQINEETELFAGSIEDAAEHFLNLLTESVGLRLRSDVPVGSSLSGGLDSSSLVMLIDQLKGANLKQNTFSARFKNFEKDEGKYVETVVKACKNVEVHYTWPDENYFLEVFDKVNYHQDEPYGSASIIAQYAVMEHAKKSNVTVLLDGQGADEYLAGYLHYYHLYLDQLFYNRNKTYKDEMEAYKNFHEQNLPYFSPDTKETLRMKAGRYRRLLLNQPFLNGDKILYKQLLNDVTATSLKSLLRYADRNSMANSREVRLPFLSHKLVEFAFSLPDEYKLNNGWTKFVLRKSMDKILPKSICWRVDKIGYEPPQKKWLQSNVIQEQVKIYAKQFDIVLDKNKQESYVNDQTWKILMAGKYM